MKRIKIKTKKGITLIALVITIIVMLILVAVIIGLSVNGGLFGHAGNAVSDTEFAKQEELKLASGDIEVDGKYYKTLDDYLEGKASEKFSAIYTETTEYKEMINGVETPTAWIPKGFAVGTSEGINKVEDGLVIQDGEGNQFVWIPVPEKNMKVATTSNHYSVGSYYQEPIELKKKDTTGFQYDSQQELDYFYGNGFFSYPEDIWDETNITDFSYGVHYKEMATSVNRYGGFYIGRYETTVDSTNKIGSKLNETVLTSNQKIGETDKFYRWWGLYYVQRHANIIGNGITIQTNMVWGQQWDKMISYFNSKGIDYSAIDSQIYNKPSEIQKSGQLAYTNNNDNSDVISDKIFNIYDLRGNAPDWTAEAEYTASSCGRIVRRDAANSRGSLKPSYVNDTQQYFFYNSHRFTFNHVH